MVASPHRPRPHPALAGALAYPLTSPAVVRTGVALVLVVTVLLGGAWCYGSAPSLWQQLGVALALVLSAAAFVRLPLWRRGTFLRWTGSKWRSEEPLLSPDAGVDLSDLAIAMDGQAWILLCARTLPSRRNAWFLLVRASCPERWPDIRRVLYSSITAEKQHIHPV